MVRVDLDDVLFGSARASLCWRCGGTTRSRRVITDAVGTSTASIQPGELKLDPAWRMANASSNVVPRIWVRAAPRPAASRFSSG
jgi:hypothetical protein